MIHFATPWFLLFALLVPLFVTLYFLRGKGREASMVFSSAKTFEGLPVGWRVRMRHLPFVLMMAAVAVFSIAAARPQSGRTQEIVKTEGIDIMLVLDISGSMRAEDFQPDNRLAVSKRVIREFVKSRKGDRIGLVLFAGKAFTQCPLTVDYDVLDAFLDRAEIGLIEDGTAIGMALATATNRLRDSTAKSKLIILLTDGVNNKGEIEPVTAAKLAATMGVKIYAIGAGTNGYATVPVQDPIFGTRRVRMKVEIDEKMLEQVANETDGHYFRATDTESLEAIYAKIDDMEKTTVELEHFTEYTEYFGPFALFGVLALALGMMLEATVLRKVS
jgi:Ca-activated chloride channel family protein